MYVVLDYTSGEDIPVVIGPFNSEAEAERFIAEDMAANTGPTMTRNRYKIEELMSAEEAAEYRDI